MTDEQLVNTVFLFGSTSAVLIAETAALWLSPLGLARLAFVPVRAERRLALGSRMRALLASAAAVEAYRRPATGPMQLGALTSVWPSEPVAGRRLLHDASMQLAALRMRFGWRWFDLGGVVRLRLALEGDDLVMSARAYPYASLTTTTFFAALAALAFATDAFFMVAFFVVVWAPILLLTAIRARQAAEPYAAAAMDTLVQRVRTFEATGTLA